MNLYAESTVIKKLMVETTFQPNLNTEVWLKRGKRNLVIVVGESWSWGDSMGGQHIHLVDNTEHRINNNLGIPAAIHYDSDFCLCAVPGGNNVNITMSLRRLINETYDEYDSIRCIIQITEPSRDTTQLNSYPLINYTIPDEFRFKNFYKEILESPVSIQEFYVWYHHKLKSLYDRIIHRPKIKYLFWRNFTRWATTPYENSIDINMVEQIGKLTDDPIIAPVDLATFYWEHIYEHNSRGEIQFTKFTDADLEFVRGEIDKVLKYFEWYPRHHGATTGYFHGTHPSELTHKMWGDKIVQSGILD